MLAGFLGWTYMGVLREYDFVCQNRPIINNVTFGFEKWQ